VSFPKIKKVGSNLGPTFFVSIGKNEVDFSSRLSRIPNCSFAYLDLAIVYKYIINGDDQSMEME
jgi:hypothetical protein